MSSNKIADKIRKLMNQAKDTEGYSAGEERANSADIGQSKVQNRLELV